MTHLYIEQNTGLTEEVSSSIISKLYELAISGDLDNTSDLKGRLHSTTGYVSQVNYLNTNFQDLIISCDNLYVEFQDPTVASILATNFGDGVGITQATVNSMTSFNGKFSGSSIVTFNELSSFPNITEINANNKFNSCTSLTSIDLSNITKISGSNGYERWNFEDCTNLTNVGDTSNVTYFGQDCFNNCSKLTSVDISSAVHIGANAFYGCTSLSIQALPQSITKIKQNGFCRILQMPSNINLPNLEEIGGSAFSQCSSIVNVQNLGKITTFGTGTNGYDRCPIDECSNLETIIIPETVTSIGFGVGNGSPKMRWVKILSTQVPTLLTYESFNVAWTEPYMDPVNGTYAGKTYPIYVRDDLLTQYQSATNWQYISFRLRPLSQFATDFPNE